MQTVYATVNNTVRRFDVINRVYGESATVLNGKWYNPLTQAATYGQIVLNKHGQMIRYNEADWSVE